MFNNGKAEKAIDGLKPELEALGKKLAEIDRINDPVDRLVAFFNAVSPWADKEQGNQGPVATAAGIAEKASKHKEEFTALQSLQAHFSNAGRDECGWNRTKPGETVTGDNVYLGNIYGRFTKTATYWKESYGKPHAFAAEDRQIIEGQAKSFVDSHIRPIQQGIGTLTRRP